MSKPRIFFLVVDIVEREQLELKAMKAGFRICRRMSEALDVLVVGEETDTSVPERFNLKNLLELSLADYVEMGGAEAVLKVVHSARQVANLGNPLPPDERISMIDQFRSLTVRDWVSLGGRIVGVALGCITVILIISSLFGAWAGTFLIIALVFGVVYKAASLLMTL